MSEHLVSPGDLIADRYRLEAVLDNTRDWCVVWFGEDTLLLRPVTVRTFDHSHPLTVDVLDAAREAVGVDDAGFIRILDIGDNAPVAHIVSSYVDAELLADVLVEGPLDAIESADLIADLAESVAVAHDKNLFHTCLDPVHILIAPGGEISVLDLGVARVLGHANQADALVDVRQLGALLYACLTSRWPLDSASGLPPAQRDKGRIVPPRRARANVSANLDRICRRALGETLGSEGPIDTARELSAALRNFLGNSGTTASQRLERRRSTGPIQTINSQQLRRRGVRALIVAVILIFVAGLVFLGFQVLNATFSEPDGSPPPGPPASAESSPST